MDKRKRERMARKFRVIQGCAGSRKTDLLIKMGFEHLNRAEDHCILFLTQIGSVTDEIQKRISEQYGMNMHQYCSSNHYYGKYRNRTVSVANYDAFIHHQLAHYFEEIDLNDIGSDFELKAGIYLEKLKRNYSGCCTRDGQSVSMILVDECQDLDRIKLQILKTIFELSTSIEIIIVGDVLQTLFNRCNTNWKKPVEFSDYHQLDLCYRCPPSHVKVANILTADMHRKYNLKPMRFLETEADDNKPVFFLHHDLSTHSGAQQTAEMVVKMIQRLLVHDKTIKEKDISVIMKRCNHNKFFEHLEGMLCKNKLSTYYTRTKKWNHERQSIKWECMDNHIKLLSIHADKGKGHPVVFFLDFSRYVVPEETKIHTQEELISESLMNVALTRSTKYLFIGMNACYPSPYFKQKMRLLSKEAIFAWEKPHPIVFSCQKMWSTEDQIRKKQLLVPSGKALYIPSYETTKSDCKKLVTIHLKSKWSGQGMTLDLKNMMENLCEYKWMEFVNPLLLEKYEKLFKQLSSEKRILVLNDQDMSIVWDIGLNGYIFKRKSEWKIHYERMISEHSQFPYRDLKEPMLFLPFMSDHILLIWDDIFGRQEKAFPLYRKYNWPMNLKFQDWNRDLFEELKIRFSRLENESCIFRYHCQEDIHIFVQQELEDLGFDMTVDKKVFQRGYDFVLSTGGNFYYPRFHIIIKFVFHNHFQHEEFMDSLFIQSQFLKVLEPKLNKVFFIDVCKSHIYLNDFKKTTMEDSKQFVKSFLADDKLFSTQFLNYVSCIL